MAESLWEESCALAGWGTAKLRQESATNVESAESFMARASLQGEGDNTAAARVSSGRDHNDQAERRARLRAGREEAVERSGEAGGELLDTEGGKDAGDDVHSVMSAKNDHGGDFERGNQQGNRGDEWALETREFDGSEDGDGGMSGEKEIVGDGVGDKQGREAWIAPNHLRGSGKNNERLDELAKEHEQHQAEEWADG